ncbi:ABC transporter permease [Bacillus sp. J14TS2]|uniref:ABC transporter permease n=1 Tax=Bacillus sp. J14TS2 TaxID=2807188 RepID=UPI001BB4177C
MSVNGKVWGNRLAQIIFLLILLGSCEWAVRSGLISTLYLAAPTEVIRVFVSYFTTEPIFTDIYVTLSEYFAGFAIAIVIGVGGGVFLAIIPKLERFSSPYLAALMAIPNVTLIPLLTLWLGIGLTQKTMIVILFCVFPILFNTLAGVKETEENHLKVARVFEASKWQIITKVLIPSAIPTIFASFRLAAASGLVGALFGEMLASRAGIGNLLTKAVSLYNTADVFALITLVTLISVLNIAIINLIEKKLFLRGSH